MELNFKTWLMEVMGQGGLVDSNKPPLRGPYYEPTPGPVLHGKCGCRQKKTQKKA